ncbi:MAG: hypothetical protein WC542_08605, partial [Paludibacter sp.]
MSHDTPDSYRDVRQRGQHYLTITNRNIMRHTILIIISILTISSLNAQLGWQIGYINTISKFDNQKLTDLSYEYHPGTGIDWNYTYETYRDKTYESGIQGGITYDLKFNHNLSSLHVGLLPIISYSNFQMQLTDELGNNSSVTINTFRNTFQVPVELVGVIPKSKDVNVIVFVGPTISVGVIMLGNTDSSSWFTGWYGQRLNLELGGGIGLQIKKTTLKVAYDFGLLKYGSNNTYTD